MESLRPLQTLADLQDALSAARTDYNHSSVKGVTNKKHIRNSKKMAFKSSFVAKSNHTERSETVDTKKQLEVDQAVAASDDRETEERHIQIFVSNPVKESLCLQLHPSTTISDLKEIIQERLNIQAKNQHLVTKRGIELCDKQSLIVLGIQQDTNLELRQVAGLMGGTRKQKSGSGQGKKFKIAKIQFQDEQETKTSSKSKQEDVTESMDLSCTFAGIPCTSTSAVQSQRTSPRTGAKNTRGRKEQMKHQSREGLATQQSVSTEKQDCLVQSQRTSPRTGTIPKSTRGRKEQMKPQSREGLVTQQSASTEKQDCLVQSQRTSPRTGAIPKSTRGRKEQMKHQSREGLVTQQSASTEKQDCLVQSQRTSPRTGTISNSTRGRKEQMRPQSREGLVTQQSASTEKQDCLVQSQRTSPRTGAIPKNAKRRKEQMNPQSQTKAKPHFSASVIFEEAPKPHKSALVHLPEEPKPHQSAWVHLPEEPKPHQSASVHLLEEPKPHKSASVHLPEEPKPHQSASVHLPEEPKPHQSPSVHLPEEPKPHQSASVHLPEEPKPHQSASVHLPDEPKPHQSASVHLPEEPIPHQSVSSTANEIASNCDSKDLVPAIHQDLAMRSQSSDALTLVNHQSQAMVNNMSIGEGSNVFMADASGITFKKKVMQHVSVTVMPHPNHQDQAIAEVTGEALKLVDMTTGAPNPDPQAQAILDELPEALKQVYMNTGSFVPMLPLVDDDKMHIMDIYTKLVLVELVDKKGKIEKEPIQMESYEDIFHVKTREGNPIKRVVFSGSAGLGKTTLCDKIAYDWAVGKSEILKRFELVFVLKMRALTTTTDLPTAISEQLLEQETVKRSDLKGFIDKNQDKVLILLDGFDELRTTKLKESSFGSIFKALNRKQYKKCWVVITSRPPLDQLLSSSLVEKPFTHVEVEGFSCGDIEKYVNKFFPDDLENVRKLIEKIQSSKVLSDLAKSPMLLLLMCLLWRESGQLPITMTRLYNDALNYIFRRKAKDLSQDEISQILISIGKVALHGLISRNKSLSFEEKDFDKKAFDAAIRAGVLTSERVLKVVDPHNNVYFIDKTFLEFCAALYWQSLINTVEFEGILVQVCSDTGKYHSPYDYLLRFCCGDNEKCTNKVLQKLQKNNHPRLGLICYFESQSKRLPSEDFINAVVSTEIRIDGWNSDWLKSFFHLVKQIINQSIIQESAYLPSVIELLIMHCDLRRFGSELANCFTNMTAFSILNLISSNVGGSASLWATHLKRMMHLYNLRLTNCILVSEDMAPMGIIMGYSFEENEDLKNLRLSNCKLIGEDIAPIAESVSDMSTLIDLDLSENDTLGGCALLWATHLKRMKHLKNLRLTNCRLVWGDMAPIAESVSDMPTLIKLDLSSNHFFSGCASLWATHLKRMKHLKNLRLSNCKLIGEDIAPIAESVSDMSTLIDLDLSENDTLGGCALLWATHLKRMKHLKNLRLSNCKLIGEDIAPIAESVCDMPTLTKLDLSKNETLGGCALLWATHLKRMKHLKNLRLTNCRLIGGDMAPIAESVSDMSTLIDLDLSCYHVLGHWASLWATHLKRMKHLKNLRLTNCSLVWGDMAPIAESVSDMPTLIKLDLSSNHFLSGCASLWATHLKRMKHLKNLRLTRCLLKEKDRRLINVAVKDIASLHVEMV
ncbi:LOW QUALITY PROTEIN: uncharacterized protein LOC117306843 [Asterias rubens]|uniref:LOW QUALITY PROTEIN: uncharacterized protein LOC117306843 n=1 Tax=Asterias rubens TaxID=7604 RepID=UPI0014553929|nr:LOW QUALITY PROTEIN: uncharacterized protein LOC117306843 [Asterias rubens]